MIKVQKVFVHPHFHSFTFDSDIALLYLAQPVVRGPTAIPVCLPDPHLSSYLLQVTLFITLILFRTDLRSELTVCVCVFRRVTGAW